MKKAYSKPDLEVLLLETAQVVMDDGWGITSETDPFNTGSLDMQAMEGEEGPGLE